MHFKHCVIFNNLSGITAFFVEYKFSDNFLKTRKPVLSIRGLTQSITLWHYLQRITNPDLQWKQLPVIYFNSQSLGKPAPTPQCGHHTPRKQDYFLHFWLLSSIICKESPVLTCTPAIYFLIHLNLIF